MRILVIVAKDPHQSFLVRLHTEELIREFKKLLIRRRNSEAMATALAKGRIEREINSREIGNVSADLIISKNNLNWDIGSK